MASSRELTWYKTPGVSCWSLYLGRRRLPVQVEQLDQDLPRMWCVVGPDGTVSEAADLARAKQDAVAQALLAMSRRA
jgi:hypothetical protein